MSFSDGFESVNPEGVTLADLHDFTETTLANDFEKLKAVNRKNLSLRQNSFSRIQGNPH